MAAKGGAADDIGKLSEGEFYFSTEGSLRPFKVRTPLCLSWHPRTRRRLRRSFRRPALNVGSSPTHYIHSRMRGVTMSGRTTSIEEAKAQFLTNWQKCRDDLAPINLRLRISRQAIGTQHPTDVPSARRRKFSLSSPVPCLHWIIGRLKP